MFIGSEYILRDQENQTLLGYQTIVIKERVLSRTETRSRGDSTVTSYHYTLMCLVNGGGGSSELMEDQLQDEIISGYYELLPVNRAFIGSK